MKLEGCSEIKIIRSCSEAHDHEKASKPVTVHSAIKMADLISSHPGPFLRERLMTARSP